jgi:integrase
MKYRGAYRFARPGQSSSTFFRSVIMFDEEHKESKPPELPVNVTRRGQANLLSDAIIQAWVGCTDVHHAAKLRDGGALYLHQRVPQGQCIWRVRCRMPDGRRPEITLGSYPELSLEQARGAAASARQLAFEGVDPTSHKAAVLAHKRLNNQTTFGFVCEVWWTDNHDAGTWTEKHANELKSIYERWIRTTSLWNARLDEIILPMAVGALNACTLHSVSTGRKLRQIIQNVGVYAVALGLVKQSDLSHVVESPKLRAYRKAGKNGQRHRPAVLEIDLAGQILYDNHNVNCDWQVMRASQMCSLVAQRPGNIASMRWADLNEDRTVWSIPRVRGITKTFDCSGGNGDMNYRSHHVVPLPVQATELLNSLDASHSPWVFFSPGSTTKHITENTLCRHYAYRLGVKGVHCPHGWRSTFSTWANDQTTPEGERMFPRDEIELILDHKVADEVERAYNRRVAIRRLRPILQAWADALYEAWRGFSARKRAR